MKLKTFRISITTSDGELLDTFEIALAGSKAAMLESCDETVGGFGSSGLCDRIKSELLKAGAK
jgi:hypothetical protein